MIDAVGNPQTVLLLGGTSDIGLAVLEQYAERKPITAILAARASKRRDEATKRLESAGATVRTLDFDARAPKTHAEVIGEAFAHGDVDIAVVAFSVLGDQEQAWTDADKAIELAEVNYVGAVSTGVALAERFRAQGHGHIVAFSSVAGERARRSNFAYGSSKAGFDAFYLGLTEALRPSGVHVTVVRPGFVHTKMTEGAKPTPLATTPEKVADIVVDSVAKHRELVWAPAQWRWVMSALRHVPRPIFRKLPI
ncbi:decaprenylphospho-beta-D-erythro-pentofuranosid-2-ulose 2-reductase [Sciscionella marina]|uniref:decaprenylphospho-beta-D-erythro-pentofuranosid- 2-ulose 2-reductase n=1 Tax=Sciscionella marina TaxID=508770 RepID=UPI00039B3668|nr:decaprenylphospho-beta-D-erythro-pentofuranosid-2-ulose 2-reductase [Sciscionella marina]